MKKATNSKNRDEISKLFPIMQEHFGQSMNLARIKLMALLPVSSGLVLTMDRTNWKESSGCCHGMYRCRLGLPRG